MATNKIVLMNSIKKNAPKILKIVGLAGLIISPILAVPSTVKAVRACDKRKEELQVEKLPVGEIVKTSWKYYIPVVSLMGASTFSMVNGESISNKRTAIISAACSAAEQTLVDYKEEAKKIIGEKKEQEIEEEVYAKRADRTYKDDMLIQGERTPESTLFYEPVTGTLFYSTKNKIDSALIELTNKMLTEIYVDLGDLFDILDLNRVEACNGYGWNSSRTHVIKVNNYKWHGIERDGVSLPYQIMMYDFWPTTNFASYV